MKKNKSNQKIKVSEIEEIKYQADMIYGLSAVFTVFLDFTEEDNQLKGAMECLMNEANRLQDNCDNLLEKICSSHT